MTSEQQTHSSTSKKCENCGGEILLDNCKGKTKKVQIQIFFATKYCSNKCKMAKLIEHIGIIKTCAFCNTNFTTLACKKTSTYCSRGCQYQAHRARKTPDRVVFCLHCNKEMHLRTGRIARFCSKACYNQSTKFVDECKICKNPFENYRSTKAKKFCSRDCANAALSTGATKVYIRGRTGYRIDLGWELYFKSSLEADFARLMKWLGYSFFYEKTTFQLGTHYYTPDFYIPELNLYVELKGPEDVERYKTSNKNLCHHAELIERGVRIVKFTQRDFTNALKEAELWKLIPNLEQRNYPKTLCLIAKEKNEDKID